MIDADLPTRRPESGQRESLGARSQFVRFTLHVAIVMLTWWETDDDENISRGTGKRSGCDGVGGDGEDKDNGDN